MHNSPNPFAAALTPAVTMRSVVKPTDHHRTRCGRSRAFRSQQDARAYERGYEDGAGLEPGDVDLLRIRCPYATGYYDAIEDADHRAFGN